MGNSASGTGYNDQMVVEFAKTSGLTEAEVRENFNEWLKMHPNGRMTKKDFKEMISTALPTFSQEDFKKMEKNLFRIYDTNNDGYIDFREFMVVFSVLTGGESEVVLRKIFRIFDVNGDGWISKKEVLQLVKDMGMLVKDSQEQFTEAEIAEGSFREMDSDGDGRVTEEEFVAAVMGHQKFSKFLTLKILDIFA